MDARAPRAEAPLRRNKGQVPNTAPMGPSPHVPFRQCVGCRARFPKKSLVRFVRLSEGGWLADPAARAPGRGAYLCSASCRDKVRKNKRFRGLAEVKDSNQAGAAVWIRHENEGIV
jgi:predicted RNA-binding protein YlxR (DUF448 family)